MNTTKADFYGKARWIYESLTEEEIEKIEIDSIEWSKDSAEFGEYETPIQTMQRELERLATEKGYTKREKSNIYRMQYEFEKYWLGSEPTYIHRPFGYR